MALKGGLCILSPARSGDRNLLDYSSRFSHRVCRHADSIGVWVWRSAGRGSAARVQHSARSGRATGCTGVDYGGGHRGRAGLEEDSLAEHRMARVLKPFWDSAGAAAFDKQSSEQGEGRAGGHHHDVLGVFADRAHTARIATR